jgi:hypothetical protein
VRRVAELGSLGDYTPMNATTKRWLKCAAIGVAVEGVLVGLCWLTAHDLFENGPDTPVSVCFAYVALWGGWILKPFAGYFADDSLVASLLAFFLYFVLPALIYSLIAYVVLRPKRVAS